MSTNPMQRISDLEAQVAALTAENQSLRANKNGNGHVDIGKVIADSFDRYGRLFREDLTVRVASHITPSIENTMRRCKEVEERQTALEEKFKTHQEGVGKSADAMAASFRKLRAEAEKDWNAHRAKMQEDFGRVDGFVNWLEAEIKKSWQENLNATTNCNLAVRKCNDLLKKLDRPVEESIAHLHQIKTHGDTIIASAAEDLKNTYRRLRQPVLKRVSILIVATILVHMVVGAVTLWRNRSLIEASLRELTEQSEQQKQEIKGLLDKTLEEAKESQIDREIKVKMWDYLMNSLTPQQRATVISKYREQVNEAERKRIDDQMKSSYEQMGGKRK